MCGGISGRVVGACEGILFWGLNGYFHCASDSMEGFEVVDYNSDHLEANDIWNMPNRQILGVSKAPYFLEPTSLEMAPSQLGLTEENYSPSLFLENFPSVYPDQTGPFTLTEEDHRDFALESTSWHEVVIASPSIGARTSAGREGVGGIPPEAVEAGGVTARAGEENIVGGVEDIEVPRNYVQGFVAGRIGVEEQRGCLSPSAVGKASEDQSLSKGKGPNKGSGKRTIRIG